MYNLLILVLLLLVQTAEELGRNNIIMEGMRDILADARLYSAELSTMPWYDNPETVETQLREIEMERIEEEKRIKAIERAERQAIEDMRKKVEQAVGLVAAFGTPNGGAPERAARCSEVMDGVRNRLSAPARTGRACTSLPLRRPAPIWARSS